MTRRCVIGLIVCLGPAFSWLLPAVAGAQTFTNSTRIDIPFFSSGISLPYPSTIAVSGLTRPIQRVSITLHGLSHVDSRHIDMLLVAPNGAKLVAMSDAGGPVANITMTLDDYGLYQP